MLTDDHGDWWGSRGGGRGGGVLFLARVRGRVGNDLGLGTRLQRVSGKVMVNGKG